MKYENWLDVEYNKLDDLNAFETCTVPIKSLELLLEDLEGLENYVKYLNKNNEDLSEAVRYYRNLADELEDTNQSKENENGS